MDNNPDPATVERLRLHIEALERLEEEERERSADKSERYKLAKAEGFDVKTMRTIIRLRRMEKNARDEQDSLLEIYRNALGLH